MSAKKISYEIQDLAQNKKKLQDGADEANLDLSKRRAESVKNELVKTHVIDAGRLETEGKGETQPIVPNDSGINKAKNRRVEFIKL